MTSLWRSMAALMIVLGACSGGTGDDAQRSQTTNTTPPASRAKADLGGEKISAIEGLPVPVSAAISDGLDTCSGSGPSGCREEYWFVPNTSFALVRTWYGKRLSEVGPWHDWKPCATPDAVTQSSGTNYYQWSKPNMSLSVQLWEEEGPRIHIRVMAADLPCN